MSIICLPFPEGRPGVADEGVSSPLEPLDGVSGRLDEDDASGVGDNDGISGLPS